jgi:hypothetical protein
VLIGGASLAVWEFDPARCRKSFARMIIAHEYPFNCANNHFLKVFVSDLQPCFKMVSRNTMRMDCLKIYEEKRVSLYELFDKLDCRTINFILLPSPHTSKNISQAIHDKLVLWNLDKKAFCLVLDNSSANDTCIRELLNTPIKDELPAKGSIFHQRCGCHILNLIVQDGLSVLCDEIKNIRETMKYIRHSQPIMEKFRLTATHVLI